MFKVIGVLAWVRVCMCVCMCIMFITFLFVYKYMGFMFACIHLGIVFTSERVRVFI